MGVRQPKRLHGFPPNFLELIRFFFFFFGGGGGYPAATVAMATCNYGILKFVLKSLMFSVT